MKATTTLSQVMFFAALACAACGGSTPPANDATEAGKTPESSANSDSAADPKADTTGTTPAPGNADEGNVEKK